jgi:hypothetical protein
MSVVGAPSGGDRVVVRILRQHIDIVDRLPSDASMKGVQVVRGRATDQLVKPGTRQTKLVEPAATAAVRCMRSHALATRFLGLDHQ